MNITIIGATKGIGKEVLELALLKKLKTTTLVRKPKENLYTENRIIQGDFLNYHSVKESITNADVVIISVGMKPTFKSVNLFSEGTMNIINAAKELNSNPLIIAVTGIGAGDSEGHGGFVYDKLFKPLLVNTIYQDKNRQEEILRKHYNNWIIVRPGFLNNGKLTEQYRILTDLKGIVAGKISRKDVAHFILKQAETPTFIGKHPLITQ